MCMSTGQKNELWPTLLEKAVVISHSIVETFPEFCLNFSRST